MTLLPEIEKQEIPELLTDCQNFWVENRPVYIGKPATHRQFVHIESEAVLKLCKIHECNPMELPSYLAGIPLTIPTWGQKFKIADDANLSAKFLFPPIGPANPSIVLRCEAI